MLYSQWSSFIGCLDSNDVTFDDMYQYLSSFSFSARDYSGSIGSYRFFCSHIEGQYGRQLMSKIVIIIIIKALISIQQNVTDYNVRSYNKSNRQNQ